MTLRQRVIAWSAGLFLVFILASGAIGAFISLRHYHAMEQEAALHEADLIRRAFRTELEALGAHARDWAAWDEAYAFMAGQAPGFVGSNLGATAFATLKIDVLVMVDSHARSVRVARSHDWRTGRSQPIPEELLRVMTSLGPLTAEREADSLVIGLVDLRDGILMAASAPIVSADRSGAPRGVLLMGRYLRAPEMARIQRATGHPVSFQRLTETHAVGPPLRAVALDENRMAGEAVLENLNGRPVMRLRTIFPRSIRAQGLMDTTYLLLALLIAGTGYFLAMYIFLDRHVLSRLQAIIDQVGRLDARSTMTPVRIGGRDEISTLARGINRILADIDVTRVAVRESEERLRKLSMAVEQSPAGILITTSEGMIEFVNARLESMTGYAAIELYGKNPRIFKSGQMPNSVYRDLWETVLSGREWQGELHNKRKDGTCYWESVTISCIRDADNRVTHFLAVKQDITAQRRFQEELHRVRRMESIGQLAGGIAHDFNNLLTVISGSVDDLRRDLSGSPVREYVEEIASAANRASDLTRQLLAFGRRQVLKPRVLDLNERLSELERVLRRVIRENIEIVMRLEPGLLRVRADASQIQQVMINLTVNARDAMPEGGRITIATENLQLEHEQEVRGLSMPPGLYVMMTVEDTGCGMSADVRERIFEPFFSTKPQDQGTGLGLATVYGIIEQSGGRIGVESTPGRGTTFVILLPGLTSGAEASAELDGLEHPSPGHGKVILVVDDESGILRVMKRTLERRGYRVVTAQGGEEALLVAAGMDRIDLLITDIIMPRLGGLELSERLRADRPGLPVLHISGHVNELGRAASFLDESNFLAKPFTVPSLMNRVQSLLAGRSAAAAGSATSVGPG